MLFRDNRYLLIKHADKVSLHVLTTVSWTPRLAIECVTYFMIGFAIKSQHVLEIRIWYERQLWGKEKKSFYHQTKITYVKVVEKVHWCVQIENKSRCQLWHVTVLKSLFWYLHAWTLYTGSVCEVFWIMYIFFSFAFLFLKILIMGFSRHFPICPTKMSAGAWMHARFHKLDLFKKSFSMSACLALKTTSASFSLLIFPSSFPAN